MVYIRMTVLYKIPRAPCPHGSTARCRRLVRRGSLEYAHSIAPKSALLYSKKKNNELFRDFTHLCNIYTINLCNGADELVQY